MRALGSKYRPRESGGTQPHRLRNVDALRGFALFGILAVNIWFFADPYYATLANNPGYDSAWDQLLRFIASLVFEAKFYLLFSFLFGYSFTLQMAAAERAGADFLPRMLRRQLGLLVLGVLHGSLLFEGDILCLYALLGVVLLACRGLPPARACRIALGLLGVAGAAWLVLGLGEPAVDAGEAARAAGEKLAAFRGDALATLRYRAAHHGETAVALAVLQAPSALAMFLLGFAAGRVRFFERPTLFRGLMRRLFWLGLPLGLAGGIVYAGVASYAPGLGLDVMAYGVGQLTAPMLTLSYGIIALRIFRSSWGGPWERALAPMGKLALSNYLGQSLLLGALFTGYGLGWIDRLSPLGVLLMVPAVFALQMGWSRWWLARHAYGPAEWCLRWLTTARRPAWNLPVREQAS